MLSPQLRKLSHWIARGVQKIKYKFQVRRTNKKNETVLDRTARSTAKATWFIAFFTAVTICVGFAQWRALHDTDERIGQQVKAMGRQLTLMESDQRPWMKVSDVKAASSLNFKSSGASTLVSIEAVNVGKSVAFNVYPSADMYVFADGKYSHAVPTAAGETCNPNTMPLEALAAAGESIFPNETIPTDRSYAVSIDRKEIDAALNEVISSKKEIMFFIVVCVDYRVQGTHYKTGVHYSIRERTPAGWGWVIAPTEGKIIERENILLQRVPNSFAR